MRTDLDLQLPAVFWALTLARKKLKVKKFNRRINVYCNQRSLVLIIWAGDFVTKHSK